MRMDSVWASNDRFVLLGHVPNAPLANDDFNTKPASFCEGATHLMALALTYNVDSA